MFNPVNIKSEHDYDAASGKYSLELFITFENFHIYRPQIHENNGATKLMFPQEARLRNFTYAASMTIDINIKYLMTIRRDELIIKLLTIHIKQNKRLYNSFNYSHSRQKYKLSEYLHP